MIDGLEQIINEALKNSFLDTMFGQDLKLRMKAECSITEFKHNHGAFLKYIGCIHGSAKVKLADEPRIMNMSFVGYMKGGKHNLMDAEEMVCQMKNVNCSDAEYCKVDMPFYL